MEALGGCQQPSGSVWLGTGDNSMNRIYRLVWNGALRVLQVTSELAGARHVGNGVSATRGKSFKCPLVLACAVALATMLGMAPHCAAAQIVGGQGSQPITAGGSSGEVAPNGQGPAMTYGDARGNSARVVNGFATSRINLTPSGVATFSGAIDIAGANPDVSVPGNIYIAAGTVYSVGGLNTPITLSGVISGPGALAVFNSASARSEVYLTGTNTYTGGTTVSGDILVLGNGGTTGSIVGNVVLASAYGYGASLEFFHSGSETFGGIISGNGNLIDSDGGTLTLTGNNTFTGTTYFGGTLQLGNGGASGALASDIYSSNGKFVIDESGTVTLPGAISGSGSLWQVGTGTTILTGINTYSGGTVISAGTLEVGDSSSTTASIGTTTPMTGVMANTVSVESGGTLRGLGTIIGSVTSDGLVWPGSSVGTLTINGYYTQNADGTLRLDVTPAQVSMLKVIGGANLAGTLDLIFAPGTYNNGTFTLVQASFINSTFGTVTGNVPKSLIAQVGYSANTVELTLAQRLITPLDGSLFGNMMRSVNIASQQDLGSVLDVPLTPSGTQCGADHAASMQNVTASCGAGIWAQYTDSNISLDGANGSNSTEFGLIGGADYALGDVVHAGVEAGVGQVNGNDTLGGNGRVGSVHGGLYAYANAGPTVLSATIDEMHSDYHFNRATGIGMAASTPGGNTQSAAVQDAWPLQLTSWQLVPKVGAIYQHQTLDGFGETLYSVNPNASSFPVDGTRSRYSALQPYADVAIQRSFVAHGVTYLSQVSLGYRYDTHSSATPIVQVMAQDGAAFDLPGAAQSRGMGTASGRITAEAGASWSLYADYQGFFGSRLHANALSVGFTKHF
jgi:fibronectin-binding autotransporter adhesin